MNALWSSRASGDGGGGSEKPSTGPQPEDGELIKADLPEHTDQETQPPTKRPLLQRNQASAPPPPSAPSGPAPPIPQQQLDNDNNDADIASDDANANAAAPPQPQPQSEGQEQGGQQQQQQQQQQPVPPPQDSLSLAQLRRIVADFPRSSEPVAYDYVYSDTSALEDEIDEWFMYNFWQWVRLNAANRAFHSAWARLFPESDPAVGWDDDDVGGGGGEEQQQQQGKHRRVVFVRRVLEGISGADRIERAEAVGAMVYLVLGRWTETVKAAGTLPSAVLEGKARSAATGVQLQAMKEGVWLVAECGGIEIVWEALKGAFDLLW
jgi:hypothetical protein